MFHDEDYDDIKTQFELNAIALQELLADRDLLEDEDWPGLALQYIVRLETKIEELKQEVDDLREV